jgi:heptosyltransferase-1
VNIINQQRELKTILRILIVKISSMGDIIHNLPILSDIHLHFPEAQIDWVVEEGFVDILKLHPQIDTIIPVAFRRWRRNPLSPQTKHEFKSFLAQLKTHQYDYVIDTQTLLKSVLIACLANGRRYGQGPKTAREWLAGFFYNHRFSVSRNQHALDQNRQLTALALDYKIPTSAPDYGLDRKALAAESEVKFSLPARYVMAFHATSRDSKLWPMGHWVSLGIALAKQGITLCLPWSNEKEKSRAEIIATHVPQAVVLPKLDLTELAYITAKANAAVGVDTGLIHLAVAMNVPSIAIYTDTHPEFNGTYGGANALAINIGGKGRLPAPDEVFNAFNRLGTF